MAEVYAVLHTKSRGEFVGIDLFERRVNAETFMREELVRYPDDNLELLELTINPWR
jgi:hypothetical protein